MPAVRRRPRPGLPPAALARLAWAGLALVLLCFAVLGGWAYVTTRAAADRAAAATIDSEALDDARYAVGAEESLERKYRIAPSSDVRNLHARAAQQLVAALETAIHADEDVPGIGMDERNHLVGTLLVHAAYLKAVERLFAAVDRGDLVLADSIDVTEIDPTFSMIDQTVLTSATTHRAVASGALAELATTERVVGVGAGAGFGLAAVLMLLFWLAMRSAQLQMNRSEVRFRSLVQNASDTVAIIDAGGTVSYCSPTALRVLGTDADALEGTSAYALVHPDDSVAAATHVETSLKRPGSTLTTELRLRHGDTWRDFEVTAINLLADPAVAGIVMTYRDVSERKAFEQALEHQAFHDSLTGLPNRSLFMDRLQRAIARAERHGRSVAVLFLDLDNFKLVNDSLGHERGDALLVEVAARLRACLREEDTVGRLGGDEFTVLVEDAPDTDAAVEVAERILATLAAPAVIGGREVFAAASIGIACASGRGTVAERLLRNADLAMYGAKTSARGRYVVFDPDMEAPALARLELQTDLRHALERNEFRVHYQPIVALGDGTVVALEALVRWQRSSGELVPPVQFIPHAEETGLIVPIGRWVLEEACRQSRTLREAHPDGPPVTMSVNLSARQLDDPDLVADIDAIVARTGIDPRTLQLEITESVAMRNPEATAGRLGELKARGIQVAIDDFGTGYSSLGYLKRLPIDTLKIDRSFVDGLGRESQDTAIVRSVVALGRTLHLCVTAEGIETDEQARLLQDLECERGQGYLYARPVPSEAIERLLRAGPIRPDAPQGVHRLGQARAKASPPGTGAGAELRSA